VSGRPNPRKAGLLVEEIGAENVIYDVGRQQVHHLNPTLTWIWRKSDGDTDIEDIAAAFADHFQVDNENASELVISGLRQLSNSSLLETPIELPEGPPRVMAAEAGVSRRSVVAAGSLLVPTLLSMSAPTPAMAKSKDKVKPPKDNSKKPK
jgi:hypothetical protein